MAAAVLYLVVAMHQSPFVQLCERDGYVIAIEGALCPVGWRPVR